MKLSSKIQSYVLPCVAKIMKFFIALILASFCTGCMFEAQRAFGCNNVGVFGCKDKAQPPTSGGPPLRTAEGRRSVLTNGRGEPYRPGTPSVPLVDAQDTSGINLGTIDVQDCFNEKLREGVVDRIGQPIEGFVPFMFMQAFSGLVPEDFDGADALLGAYKIVEKELVFILDEGGPIHSAAEVLSEEGMKTVFANIQRRSNVLITTTDEVDRLLLFLGTPLDVAVTECLPEQRGVDACIEIYQPVCATVMVRCVTTPCDPVQETFANSCKACMNSLVSSYTKDECSVVH